METMYIEMDDDIQLVKSFRKIKGGCFLDYPAIYTRIKKLAKEHGMRFERTTSGKPMSYRFWKGDEIRSIELFSDFIPVWPDDLVKYDYVQICIYGKKNHAASAHECVEKCSEILLSVGMEEIEL